MQPAAGTAVSAAGTAMRAGGGRPSPPRARRELFRRPAVIDRLGMDNLLILAVLVILLMDGCSDTLLLIALAYLPAVG